MARLFKGAVTLALATSTLNGCYVYRDPAYAEGPPPPPGEQVPEGAMQPPEAQPEPAPPPGFAAPPAAPPPEYQAQPQRRRRRGAQAAFAPSISAPIAFGNGTAGAFRGLVYLVPDDVNRLPDFSTLKPIATLYTDRFDVRPHEFKGGFPGVSKEDEWFAIRYDGTFFAPEGGLWRFRMLSDDGSALYIDGRKVIDNDGVHGVRASAGTVELGPGRHHLRLDYFQGNRGPVALQLFATAPSAPRSEFIVTGKR